MRYLIIAAISFIQLSCAPKLAFELTSFEQQQPSVLSWSDLPYQPLMLQEESKVLIDEVSPVYLFSSGKSHVLGFALPAHRPLEVSIKSYLMGNSVYESYLFVPCVLLLNEKFQVIHSLEQTDSLIERTTLFDTPYAAFKNSFTFTIWPNPGVSYLVVYTTDEQLHQVSTITMMTYSQVILPGYVGAVPLGKRIVAVPHAPVGRLKILVKDFN